MWGVVAVVSLSFATGCSDSSQKDAAPASVEFAPPPKLPPSSFSMWLSATRVPDREPVELLTALVNRDGGNASFSVMTSIERWDGRSWVLHRRLVMCLDQWFCTAEPGLSGEGGQTIPAIALVPRLGVPKMTGRISTQGLTSGWYRITNVGGDSADESKMARAVFEVAADAVPIAPLHAAELAAGAGQDDDA